MEGGLQNNHPFLHSKQEDPATTLENVADSPLSSDETAETSTPSPRRSRRGAQKRVVSVPISESDGSRSKGEVYPPPDSWSWRKYGQKPIKGSPYPRGYYRCSSAKGCPARKQVERSRVDPTVLLITYSCDHNHPLPTSSTKHHHPTPTPSTATVAATSTSSSVTPEAPSKYPPEKLAVFAYEPDLESDNSCFTELAGQLGWFSDVGSTVLEGPTLLGPSWADVDVAVMLPIGEEDQSLFGDLGELPEYSVVFRRQGLETPCCGSTG